MTVAKKIISTLLVAAVAVGIGLVLALLLPQGDIPRRNPPPPKWRIPPSILAVCRATKMPPQNTTTGILLVSL